MNKNYIKSLVTSLSVFTVFTGIAMNSNACYSMEETNTKYNINYDKRCTNLVAKPVLRYYNDSVLDEIIEFCEKNKAIELREVVVDFAVTCNRIATALFYGSQMEYQKGSYVKKRSYNELLYEWSNSIIDLNGIFTNKTQENSGVAFWNLLDNDINVSSNFLKNLNASINIENFKLFDNEKYLNNDVQIVKLCKYLGNRVLELAHESFRTMYEKLQNNSQSTEDIISYLEKSIFGNIILPFYDNLKSINNSLNTISKYIYYRNYDKSKQELLNKQLQSTADYIDDVLNKSEIRYIYNYFKEYNFIPRKQDRKLFCGYRIVSESHDI